MERIKKLEWILGFEESFLGHNRATFDALEFNFPESWLHLVGKFLGELMRSYKVDSDQMRDGKRESFSRQQPIQLFNIKKCIIPHKSCNMQFS